MCRLAAYVGAPAALSTLLLDPPHSLLVQSHDPREQIHGQLNVDGTGVAWWSAEEPGAPPLRYVTERTLWSDPNLAALAPRLFGRVQIAAVRSATPGVLFGPGNVAPFVHGALAGAHNGFLGRFREATGRALAARLPDAQYAALDAVSDSQLLFLRTASLLEGGAEPLAGATPLAAAVRAAVLEAAALSREHAAGSTLNLVVSDGESVVAARLAEGCAANTLYTLEGGRRWPEASLLASEPLDEDPAWQPVPEGTLVELTADGVARHALDGAAA